MEYSRVLLQRLSLSGYAAHGTLLPTEEPLKSPGLLVYPSQHDPSRCFFPMQKRIKTVVVTLLALLSLFILYRFPYRVTFPLWSSRHIDFGVGNRTLGFQAILAVSPREVQERHAWRKAGLLAAANRTGLRIDVPVPQQYTSSEVENVLAPGESGMISDGYIKSFMNHLNALKIATDLTSTLILEDDSDWDVEIRASMPKIAGAIRNVSIEDGDNSTIFRMNSPYGNNWDLLWLGNGGDTLDRFRPYTTFEDPLVPPYINNWVLPSNFHGHRWVTHSLRTHGTYGYGVTKHSAAKILSAAHNITAPYDLFLDILCQEGVLRCLTVSPMLFFHHEKRGNRDSMVEGQLNDKAGDWDKTENILHSARCNAENWSEELLSCMGKDKTANGGME